MGGRLGILCQRIYDRADHPGYLEMGTPVHYGSGAAEVIREVVTNPAARYKLTSDSPSRGRHRTRADGMAQPAPAHRPCARPRMEPLAGIEKAAQHYVDTTASPALLDFPPLLAAQQRRLS